MPSAPFTNGAPAQPGNSWDMPPGPPVSGPFTADYPSQYPSYFGNGSGQLDQRSQPQQQMPPMFMVNPPDLYPPDGAMTPYGLTPNGPLSMPGMPVPVPAPSVPVANGRQSLSLVPALSPGTALKNGRYRIIQRFASGSAGGDNEPPLMIATDTELPNERVLVQELPLSTMHPDDAEYIRHGIAERLDSLSQTPGMAHLRDSFVEQRRHFLVFEMPSGDRLLDRLRRAHGPLPETTVIGIMLQVLQILETLERSAVPLIHGNISPANILLRPGGQVTLVGFSPTLLIYPTGQVAHGPAGALSHYSAPEQARGTADTRTDLYAVCAVMHHAVTGVEPVGRMFPLARHANPAVSLELEDILGQGLRPSPGQRYQTPGALHEALAPLASGKRLTHVDEELDPDSPTGLRPLRDAQGRLIGPRQRITQNPLFFVGIVLVLVAMLGGGVFYAMQPRTPPASAPSQTISSAFAPYYQSKGIGLSGGEFVFDTQLADYSQKQRGALALAAGDINGALNAYQAAVSSQPADVEALIYAADLRILAANSPYVTVIAGVAFGSDADISAARYEMQGIYLAQQRFNQTSSDHGSLHLRVLILNSGKNPADAQLAANLMLGQIRQGNVQHIVGIIGWPGSNQTRLAMAALGASGMPVISPTASANNLEDTAGNFYALVPSDSQQAADLADAAVNNLQAHHVLVAFDPNDQQNSDIATNFSNRIVLNYSSSTTILGRVAYDTASMQDPSAFKDVAAQALSQNADLIYVVGDSTAAIFLANAVEQTYMVAGRIPPHILVGAQTVMAPFFGVGSDAGALAARANPNALSLLYVATLASIDHWHLLNIAYPDVSAFSDSFSTLFKGVWGTGGMAQPGSVAILSYDATNMLMLAVGEDVSMAQGVVNIPTAQQITIVLGEYTAKHPFVGLGGAVAFSNAIHQPNKALGIYSLLPIPNAAASSSVAQLRLVSVIGGAFLFCGQSTCRPY
jgi:ABC-type branched-subunit amino acid transport system substrate-binding protein/serine/threonine protein kinase